MKYKMVFIMLLVVIFTFAVIGTHNMNILEGLENSTENVPTCANENVPSCYSTVQYEDYEQFDASKKMGNPDDYILKTQIVPPVCPACPSISNTLNGSKVDSKTGNNDEPADTDDMNNETKMQEQQQAQMQEQQQAQMQEQQQAQIQNQATSTNVNVTVPAMQQQQKMPNASMFPSQSDSGNVDALKQQIKQLKQQMNQKGGDRSGECPPCPACERCPEAAFTCEKVPNYRSSQIGSYLPIPVVNDFSTF
jgi:hypothetical protein